MKCERCGGSGKYFQENPDCANCPSKGECDDFGKKYCTVPSACPDCNGTGTKPEPEQDERIREAFEKTYPYATQFCDFKNGVYVSRRVGDVSTSGYWQNKYQNFKSGYTSRNAEIEALKAEIAKNKRKAEKWDNLANEMKCSDGGQHYNDMISAITAKINAEVIPLKAEIESMRCCGNCSSEKGHSSKECRRCKRWRPSNKKDNWTKRNEPT